jgi:hypothetical protein
VDVIEPNTESKPFVPALERFALPAPPEPTVTVIVVPEETAYPVAVLKPPAPPPPPIQVPPPPPPATTKYSTVGVTKRAKLNDPELVQIYVLYPPEVIIVGLPVVLVAAKE